MSCRRSRFCSFSAVMSRRALPRQPPGRSGAAAFCSGLLCCRTDIHEGPGLGAFHVAGFERVDPEAGVPDQIIHLAVEVAAAADTAPAGRQAVLPTDNRRFGREAVLNEKETPGRLQDATHLV